MTHRGLRQVHGFEDQTHDAGHLYDLPTHQAEFFVVIQHGVHVLNPHSIYGSVKDDPLAVGGVGGGKVTESVGHHTIRPLRKVG